jgi:hypothetical protein
MKKYKRYGKLQNSVYLRSRKIKALDGNNV